MDYSEAQEAATGVDQTTQGKWGAHDPAGPRGHEPTPLGTSGDLLQRALALRRTWREAERLEPTDIQDVDVVAISLLASLAGLRTIWPDSRRLAVLLDRCLSVTPFRIIAEAETSLGLGPCLRLLSDDHFRNESPAGDTPGLTCIYSAQQHLALSCQGGSSDNGVVSFAPLSGISPVFWRSHLFIALKASEIGRWDAIRRSLQSLLKHESVDPLFLLDRAHELHDKNEKLEEQRRAIAALVEPAASSPERDHLIEELADLRRMAALQQTSLAILLSRLVQK